MVASVAVLALEPAPMFEVAVACEVFGLDRRDDGVPLFDFRVCGLATRPIATTSGVHVVPERTLRGLHRADLVIVPGWHHTDREPVPRSVVRALRRAHERGARVASFCSGAFALAAAGLLEGRRAATHWLYAEALQRAHPGVEVDRDVLYVDEDPIFTSAGTAAAIDLCLHLVRKDHGAAVASVIARRMICPPHRDGGQAQYVRTAPAHEVEAPGAIDPLMAWAVRNLDRDLSVATLARRARMAPRTFARSFKQTTGATPHQWVTRQRVAEAQRLLETTRLSVDRIASRCGLGTAPNLRVHFTRIVGTTPTAYRATFRR